MINLISFWLGSKNLFSESWRERQKNLGADQFPDPDGYFEAPWWPFLIFEVLIEGMIESKNLFSESWSEGPVT